MVWCAEDGYAIAALATRDKAPAKAYIFYLAEQLRYSCTGAVVAWDARLVCFL